MRNVGGVYYAVRADYSQLKKDMLEAGNLVKKTASEVSRELNGAVNADAASKSINSLITNLSSLSQYSATVGKSLGGIGVELGSLNYITGVSSEKFAEFQARLLEVKSAQVAEKSFLSLARQLGLTRSEVQDVGRSFGLADTAITAVAAKIKTFPELSTRPLQSYAEQMRALGSGFDTFYEKMAAAMGRGPSLKTFDSKQFWDAIVPSDVPIDRIEAKIDEAFSAIGRYIQKPQVFKNPAYSKQFWDAILPGDVPLDQFTAKIDAAFGEVEAQAKRAQAKVWLSDNSAAEKAANQTKAIFASLAAQEAEANKGLLSFQSSVSSSMSSVEAKLQQAAQAFNMPKEQVDQLRAKAQQQIELKIKTDTLKQLAQDAGLAKEQIAALEKQFGVTIAASQQGGGLLGAKGFGGILTNTLAYGGAYQLLGWIQQMPGAIIAANSKLETLHKSFEGVFGVIGGGEQFAYVSGVAQKYGKDLESVASAYRKYAAGAEYAGQSTSDVKKVFEGTVQALTKVGGSSDDVNGALVALGQMINKETVSAEEFRQQFAERIPGAMRMGANALGVTTTKFKEMMESGQVIARDFLPMLAVELQKFGAGWEASADTIQTNAARVGNSLQSLVENRYLQEFTNASLKSVDALIKGLDEGLRAWGDLFTAMSMKKTGLLPAGQSFDEAQKSIKEYISLTDEAKKALIDSKIYDYDQKAKGLLSEGDVSSAKEYHDYLKKIADLEEMRKPLEKSEYIEKVKEQISSAQALAKEGINPEVNSQRVEFLAKVLGDLTHTDWTVFVDTRVDMSQLNLLVSTVNKLTKGSAQQKIDTASDDLKRLTDGSAVKELESMLGVAKAALSSENIDTDKATAEVKRLETALKGIPNAIVEANNKVAEGHKELAKFTYEQTEAYKSYKNKYGGGLVEVGKLPAYGDISQADAAQMKYAAHWQQLSAELKTGAITEKGYWVGLQSIMASKQGELDAIANKQNKGASAAAHHAVAVEKLGDTLQNYLAKQMGLANDDTLGARFADIAKQADNLRARAKDLAIAGGVDLKTFFSDLDKATEAARANAADNLLEKLFPWFKKDDNVNSGFKAIEQHYDDVKAAAERAGKSIEWAYAQLGEKGQMAAYKQQLAEVKDALDNAFSFSEYKANRDKFTGLEFKDSGVEEKKSWEDLLKVYDEVSGKMYKLRSDMYDRIAEKARAEGMDEARVQSILLKQREEDTKKSLEQIVEYSSSFGETMSAKWSLAFGGYKSASTKARESWDQMADSIISSTNGMIDGIAGGFGDLIRNIGNGTASIEDLWKNMLARMLDAFASFVENLIKQQLQDLVGGLFTGSGSSDSVSIGSLTGGVSGGSGTDSVTSLKTVGKTIASSLFGELSSGSSQASTFISSLSKANTSGISDVFKAGNLSGWSFSDGSSVTGSAVSQAAGLSSASSMLGTVGSVLGVVGAIGGIVGLVSSLFGSQEKEVKKTASGYNVGYNAGHATSYGVDFYSDGSVVPTGASDPDVQKKIADAFRNTAESLQDFAEELGFAVDVLEGFSMPSMNVTDDQLDSYIRNGENMMAFKGLMEAGMRGAFDAVARDGEVYVDEYERLATSLSVVKGGFEAYGYELSDVAQITQQNIDDLRVKNTEVANGTADAMRNMATSMGATADVLAQITEESTHAAAALAVTDEQLSNILEADYASDLLDAVGGEDAFNTIMGNLTKNIFDSIGAYAENLDYYNEKAGTAINKLGDASVTVDNFWIKFDEAIKSGLTVDEFEAWGKASSWVANIQSVEEAMSNWNDAMTKTGQNLDQRMAAAQGYDYQSKLSKQMADAEWELADARKAGYSAAVLAQIQAVQAAELAATIAKHQADYANEVQSAQERIANATGDKWALVEIQKQKNALELQTMSQTYNWSPGSAEEGLFQALQQAQALEIANMAKAITDALEKATTAMANNLDAREAKLAGNDELATAIGMTNSAIAELNQAYEDGLDADTIARLISVQNAEMEAYLASIDSTLVKTEQTLTELLASLLDDMNALIDSQITAYQDAKQSAEDLATAYHDAAKSIYTTLTNWAIDDKGKTPDQTFAANKAVFESYYAKAMAGDSNAFSALSSYADSLRSAGLNKFGSYDEYQAFYRDLQEKMGAAALKSDALGDKKSDLVKLYDVQLDLYELLKTELAKDDPNTALLTTLGNTMSLVQSGIDTGNSYQETIKTITENPAGTGGYDAIRKAIGEGNNTLVGSLALMTDAQTALMSLLEEYLNASNRSSLEAKTQLAYQQYQQSYDQEVATFRNSTLGTMLATFSNARVSDQQMLSDLLGYANGSGYGTETGYSWYELLSNPNSTLAGSGEHPTIGSFTDWYLQNYGTNNGAYTRDWSWMYEQLKNNYSGYAFGNISGSAYGSGVLPASLLSQQTATASYYQKYLDLKAQLDATTAANSSARTLSDVSSFDSVNGAATASADTTMADIRRELASLREELAALRRETTSDNAKKLTLMQKNEVRMDRIENTSLNVTVVS